ncbi:MAG: peptide-methionine (R)-S-oxide reductase MsrB [Hyphomonadaceae bacterium]
MSDAPSKTDLKSRLSPEQYAIACEHGTERPFSNPLNGEKRAGLYKCAACGETLFISDSKYDSGSGWPSFWAPASSEALGTTTDYKIGYPRTEVHCAKCGSHMGHVFEDGPRDKTGLRYCINGAVLDFEPNET